MKKWCFALAALATLAGSADAATIETSKGTQALVFSFRGLSDLDLSSYAGGIGFRHYLGDGTAVRSGLQFGIDDASTELSADPAEDERKDERSSWSLGADIVLEKHLEAPRPGLSPYLGLGAGVEYSRDTREMFSEETTTKAESSRITATGFGAAGFEAAVMDGVTLGGEYRLQLAYASTSAESKQSRAGVPDRDAKSDTSLISSGISTAGLYLSISWK